MALALAPALALDCSPSPSPARPLAQPSPWPGTHDAVNFICDEPAIRAISFVGGDAAGKHIYSRASANGQAEHAPLNAAPTPQPQRYPYPSASTLPLPLSLGLTRQARAGQPRRAEPCRRPRGR